eukprot:1376107-Amorphochlora_amoeboformis.AAC.1
MTQTTLIQPVYPCTFKGLAMGASTRASGVILEEAREILDLEGKGFLLFLRCDQTTGSVFRRERRRLICCVW